jgi:acetylornithine aminotransferase
VGLTRPVAKEVVALAQQRGLIINAPTENTIRLLPPLTIGDVEIDEFIALFAGTLAAVESSLAPTDGVSA